MESGKEVKKKINVLEAMHYIMAAWQQVSQQTIQNCFRKAKHKYQVPFHYHPVIKWQTMVMISAKTGKNCVEPRNTISKAMSHWITKWQEVALKLLKNYEHLGLQGVWRKKMMKMNKRWCRDLRSFTNS
jgi:predicted GTPase